ncbi:MAG TPA: glycosyltransferase family 61 protein [Pirellulaceae bacterium]|nr:glycosyltransferase family 61 protein [Pirellulaceae bacterium]
MHARLAHRVVREARIQAFKPPLLQFRGGLVPCYGDPKLRQRRRDKPTDSYDEIAAYPHRMGGEFVYGGPVYKNFGHFMAETVHRIVPSKLLYGAAPWIFVTVSGKHGLEPYAALPTFVRDVHDLLGIGARDLRLVGQNTIVEQLFVAEQGSELGLGPKPGYLDDLSEYVLPRLDARHRWDTRPKKVYVSRARKRGGCFLGERYLEEQLEAEGFTVVHPELLPVSVQMDHYRKAEVLIFPEGSACHGVELLGSGSLGRTYLLVRRERMVPTFERILRPRATDFATSSGHSVIGTKYEDSNRESNTRLAVLVFDVNELVAFFRTNNIARLPTFSEEEYLSAAEADLLRYLGGGAYTAKKRLSRFVRRLAYAVFPDRKMGRVLLKPGARRVLKEAFQKHVKAKRL